MTKEHVLHHFAGVVAYVDFSIAVGCDMVECTITTYSGVECIGRAKTSRHMNPLNKKEIVEYLKTEALEKAVTRLLSVVYNVHTQILLEKF